MLLKNFYDFAISRKILESEPFENRLIRWVIPIDFNGNLVGYGPIELSQDKVKGKEYSCPKTSRPKDAGGIAEFLADGVTALFGIDSEPEKYHEDEKRRKGRDENNCRKFDDFWSQIKQASEETENAGLKALLLLKDKVGKNPGFLRRGKSKEQKDDEKLAWWITTASKSEKKLGNDTFTFQVGPNLVLLDEVSVRPWWRKAYFKEVADKENSSEKGFCLITGNENLPIAATHLPKIKGIPQKSKDGFKSSPFGAAIVSFDKPAFASYGFDQSMNAPVSSQAVRTYCKGLNWLLDHNDHSIRIGDTVLCFWAKELKTESSFFAKMLNKPDPKSVSEFVKSPWSGISRELIGKDRFYSVTLSGNSGRVIVRHWLQMTIEGARENLKRWFEDLEIVSFGKADESVSTSKSGKSPKKSDSKEKTEEIRPPLAIFKLACTTVREAKDLQSDVPAQLYRAALEGNSPSMSLMKPILARFKADLGKFGVGILETPIKGKTLRTIQEAKQPIPPPGISRFALLRLILNRSRKEGDPMIESKVFETADAAYNCGRLLAVFDDLQMAAHEWKLEGAGVVERYYGSASSAPNSAFGILWRLHQHHLRKLSRQGEKGKTAANAIKSRIGEIVCRFVQIVPNQPPSFPRAFNLQEQGRFALGFYQQKADSEARRREYSHNKDLSGLETPETFVS